MAAIRKFLERSRERHIADWDSQAKAGPIPENAGTVDGWRHDAMLEPLLPLLRAGGRWLTVGDGRFGDDARYLLGRGVEAIASDLDTRLLARAAAAGRIREFRAENAEALSLADDAVDWVLCKESFHHFPRPWHAFHEMLRVARCGIALVEPQDRAIHSSLWHAVGGSVKTLLRSLGGAGSAHQFEDSGNYVYALSRREVEKAALGVNCPHVAFKEVNVLFLPALAGDRVGSPGFKLFRLITAILDVLSRVGLWRANVLVAIVFKQPPGEALRRELRAAGFSLPLLPINPYIGGTS